MDFNFNFTANVHHYFHDGLAKTLEKIMATLQQYIDQQTAFNNSMAADVSAIADRLTAIDGDVTALNQNISDLKAQLASGNLSTEQQASLDKLVAAGADLSAKTKVAATSAAALDDRTPPVPPPSPAPTP